LIAHRVVLVHGFLHAQEVDVPGRESVCFTARLNLALVAIFTLVCVRLEPLGSRSWRHLYTVPGHDILALLVTLVMLKASNKVQSIKDARGLTKARRRKARLRRRHAFSTSRLQVLREKQSEKTPVFVFLPCRKML